MPESSRGLIRTAHAKVTGRSTNDRRGGTGNERRRPSSNSETSGYKRGARSKALIKSVTVRISNKTCVAGIYIVPQTCGDSAEKALQNVKGEHGERTVITGKLNAMHTRWDRMTNGTDRVVVKCVDRWN